MEACDRGDEPCCVNTTIAVDVLDVNDNKPQILNVPNECLSVLEVWPSLHIQSVAIFTSGVLFLRLVVVGVLSKRLETSYSQ